jgi:hypothetical protein
MNGLIGPGVFEMAIVNFIEALCRNNLGINLGPKIAHMVVIAYDE